MARPSKNAPPIEPNDQDLSSLPFEDAISRLESAVQQLEGGGLGLDEALSQYEQGVRLVQRCQTLLERAERQVALLTDVDPDGNPQTAPFEGLGATIAPSRRPIAPPDPE